MRAIRSAAAWLAAFAVASSMHGEEIYRRSVATAARIGVVRLASTLDPWIEVATRCRDETTECRETRRFRRAYRLEFLDEQSAGHGASVEITREPRGTLWLALALDTEAERSFDRLLRETLTGLAATAFEQPFAGLGARKPPLSTLSTEGVSDQPSWACFANGDSLSAVRYAQQTRVGSDGKLDLAGHSISSHSNDEVAQLVCRSLGAAVDSSLGYEELRTRPMLERLEQHSVTVAVVDRTPEALRRDELLPLPPGASFRRRERPEAMSGGHQSPAFGANGFPWRSAAARLGLTAKTVPADLDAWTIVERGWLARLTLRSVEQILGPMPSDRLLDTRSAHFALVPTSEPHLLRPGDDSNPPPQVVADEMLAPSLDGIALLRQIAQRLATVPSLDAGSLESAVFDELAGLGDPGWLLVWCSPEGDATWGLPPTKSRSRVDNGNVVCTALASAIY